MTPSQEERDERAARRHQQREADRRAIIDGARAIQGERALQIARGRHGCRGILAPLPVTGHVSVFECADCHDFVDVSMLEAAT